jgi:hypothetical protein
MEVRGGGGEIMGNMDDFIEIAMKSLMGHANLPPFERMLVRIGSAQMQFRLGKGLRELPHLCLLVLHRFFPA